MEPNVGRIVPDKRRSTMGGRTTVHDAAGDPDLRRTEQFRDRVEKAARELDEQRQQYRLYLAQRYQAGGVKLDPVLRSHLGL